MSFILWQRLSAFNCVDVASRNTAGSDFERRSFKKEIKNACCNDP